MKNNLIGWPKKTARRVELCVNVQLTIGSKSYLVPMKIEAEAFIR